MPDAVLHKAPLYSFSKLFWSIYFVFSIVVVGCVFVYPVVLGLFIISLLLLPQPALSEPVRRAAEQAQCHCIRFLLRLQPWLSCETNLPPITGFYDQFKTRRILFVANHRSNLDTFLLISFIPGLGGLAKRTLFYNIFFAPFMIMAGFIPVEKGSPESFMRGLHSLRNRLSGQNRPILMFPENTRCEKGFPTVNKFSSAIFGVALESQALIIPLVIEETDSLMGRGDLLICPHKPVKITMLKPIYASQYQDSVKLRDDVWKLIQTGIS